MKNAVRLLVWLLWFNVVFIGFRVLFLIGAGAYVWGKDVPTPLTPLPLFVSAISEAIHVMVSLGLLNLIRQYRTTGSLAGLERTTVRKVRQLLFVSVVPYVASILLSMKDLFRDDLGAYVERICATSSDWMSMQMITSGVKGLNVFLLQFSGLTAIFVGLVLAALEYNLRENSELKSEISGIV